MERRREKERARETGETQKEKALTITKGGGQSEKKYVRKCQT